MASETDCTKLSEGLKSYDEHVQSDHLREAIDISEEETEAILYGLHQEKPPVSTTAELALGDKERKTTTSNNVEDNLDDFMDVGFPESCLKALACMLHVAKTASKVPFSCCVHIILLFPYVVVVCSFSVTII